MVSASGESLDHVQSLAGTPFRGSHLASELDSDDLPVVANRVLAHWCNIEH